MGLARPCYCDPAVLELEWDRVFRPCWLCAGHRTSLAEPGAIRAVKIGPYPLLITRNARGEVRAMHNVCRHRGAKLVDDTCSTTPSGGITCPYHAWRYDLEGRLTAAPNMRDVTTFDPAQFSLQRVSCVERLGMIWVSLQPADDFDSVFQPLQQRIAPWQIDELFVAHTLEYEVAANWKTIFQNYSECYHCPTVHPALNRLTPYKQADNDLASGMVLGGPMQLSPECDSMTTDGRLAGVALPGLDPSRRRQIVYYTVFPTMFLSLHPDYVLVHRLMPLSVDRTQVVCEFLFHPDARQLPQFDPRPAVEFWDVTNRQDWRVCELTQQGMSSPAYQPGPYSNLESVLAAFDRHYRSIMVGNHGRSLGKVE